MAKNVIADIMYLNYLDQSDATNADQRLAAQKEWGITTPADNDTAVQNALCGKDDKNQQLIYWPSLKHSPSQAVCQSSSVLAVADFTVGN